MPTALPPYRLIIPSRRRSQVVRQRSAKPPFVGSIPTGASARHNNLGASTMEAPFCFAVGIEGHLHGSGQVIPFVIGLTPLAGSNCHSGGRPPEKVSHARDLNHSLKPGRAGVHCPPGDE